LTLTYPGLADVYEALTAELGIPSTMAPDAFRQEWVRHEADVEAALDRMEQTVFGEEVHETVCEKAAPFVQALIQRHPFIDGNKRTAVRVAYAFIKYNGRTITATEDDTVEMARDVAVGNYEVDELADWFQAHTKPVDDS